MNIRHIMIFCLISGLSSLTANNPEEKYNLDSLELIDPSSTLIDKVRISFTPFIAYEYDVAARGYTVTQGSPDGPLSTRFMNQEIIGFTCWIQTVQGGTTSLSHEQIFLEKPKSDQCVSWWYPGGPARKNEPYKIKKRWLLRQTATTCIEDVFKTFQEKSEIKRKKLLESYYIFSDNIDVLWPNALVIHLLNKDVSNWTHAEKTLFYILQDVREAWSFSRIMGNFFTKIKYAACDLVG